MKEKNEICPNHDSNQKLPFKSCSKGDPGVFQTNCASIPKMAQSISEGFSPIKKDLVPKKN